MSDGPSVSPENIDKSVSPEIAKPSPEIEMRLGGDRVEFSGVSWVGSFRQRGDLGVKNYLPSILDDHDRETISNLPFKVKTRFGQSMAELFVNDKVVDPEKKTTKNVLELDFITPIDDRDGQGIGFEPDKMDNIDMAESSPGTTVVRFKPKSQLTIRGKDINEVRLSFPVLEAPLAEHAGLAKPESANPSRAGRIKVPA